MYKRFFYIIGFSLCLLQTKGQTVIELRSDVKRLINSIAAQSIKKGTSLDPTCEAKASKFIKLISHKKEINLTESKALKSLSDDCDSLKLDSSICNDSVIKKLITSTETLKINLGKLIDSLKSNPGNNANQTVRIKIKLHDSAGNNVNGTIRVTSVDSTIKINTLKNDSGYEIQVVSGRAYSINAKANGYAIDTQFTASPGTTELDIPIHSLLTPSASLNKETSTLPLFIIVSVLFVITLVAFILSISIRKNLRLVNTGISDLADQIKSTQQTMKENNDKAPVPQSADETAVSTPDTTIPLVNETAGKAEQNEPVINRHDANGYFVCELMMTAGPRKDDFEDVDLGEDVCGFISNSNEALVWVLDGTSDADRQIRLNNSPANDENQTAGKKEVVYFSSRLLAQSIANKIKKIFAQKTTEPLEEIMNKIINEVKEDWQKTFDELPADDKKELEKTVKHKSSIQCSTTVLIARLSINGELTAYRVGDSKMLVFENTVLNGIRFVETVLQEKNVDKNDRVFFSLQLNKSNESIHFMSNNDKEGKLKYETISRENIGTIISFSDGVGQETQDYLKDKYEKDGPEKTKEKIIHHLQGTEDDKSICFIEIKQNS